MSEETPSVPSVEKPKRSVLRKLIRAVLMIFVPIGVLVGAAQMYLASGGTIDTDNAYVKARLHNISAEIDGRVRSVQVLENERVSKGQILLDLDREPFEIAKRSAEAELASIRQAIESKRSEYRRSLIDIDLAKKRIAYFKTQHDRKKKLRAKGVSSVAQLDEATFQLRIAEEELHAVEETRRKLLTDLGGDLEMATTKHPSVRRALAALDRTMLDLRRTRILAPANGIVAKINPEPGEGIKAMEPIVLLVDESDVWIEANLKETKLTHVREGQVAEVTVDTYPDVVWRAIVDSIAPATGAEFALLPPQNASGNWIKVVQRLPVRMTVMDKKEGLFLRSGMTASVSIWTGHKPRLPTVIKKTLALTEELLDRVPIVKKALAIMQQ